MKGQTPRSAVSELEPLSAGDLQAIAAHALCEDLGGALELSADLTTTALVAAEVQASGTIFSRRNGVVAGLDLATAVFGQLDAQVACDAGGMEDGSSVADGAPLLLLHGSAAVLLTGERTALNFLQRLSGIATLTSAYVAAVAHTSARITDTRKTTPGLRQLEQYAVRCGGGVSHRSGLHDAILIKENHAALAGGVAEAVRRARAADFPQARASPAPVVMVEVTNLEEVGALLSLAAEIQPNRILLDNMTREDMAEAVDLIRAQTRVQARVQTRVQDGAIEIEATGGITLANVRGIAETGVDLISIGALTHSAPALDMSLLLD